MRKKIYTLGIRFSGEEDDVFVFDRFCSIGRQAQQLEKIGEFIIDYFCQFENQDAEVRAECDQARKIASSFRRRKLRPKKGVTKDSDEIKARLIEIRDFFSEKDWGFFNLREDEIMAEPVWNSSREFPRMIQFGDYYI